MTQNRYGSVAAREDADSIADEPLSQSQREIYLAWLCEEGANIQNELTAGIIIEGEAYRRAFDLLHCSIQFMAEDLGDFGLKH